MALHGEALVALDKLDKIGRDGVEKELVGTRHRAPRAPRPCLASSALRRCPPRTAGWSLSSVIGERAAGSGRDRGRSSRWLTADRGGTAARHFDRPEPGARAVILHGRDHGDRRARSGRQPRRRRPLRQPDRDVSRPRRAGLRLLARSRADHRRHDRAGHVSGRRSPAAASTSWSRSGTTSREADALQLAARTPRRAACASTSIPRQPTSSTSSSSTRRAAHVPFVAIVGDDERAQRDGQRERPATAAPRTPCRAPTRRLRSPSA